MTRAISWKHTSEYLSGNVSLEKKIDVYEAQMWGWQLHVADLIINGGRDHDNTRDVPAIPHSAFAALQVGLVYFEAIAKYEEGYTGRDSRAYFIKGLLSVFPELATASAAVPKDLLALLYEGARCGLYHMAITAPAISLARTGEAITFIQSPKGIIIDPHALIPRLKDHFAAYVARLRDPSEQVLQQNFERCFGR